MKKRMRNNKIVSLDMVVGLEFVLVGGGMLVNMKVGLLCMMIML